MEENKDQSQKKNSFISLAEKKKFWFFLKIGVRNNSLKNHTLIKKVRKEIAREMTLINRGKNAKNNSN